MHIDKRQLWIVSAVLLTVLGHGAAAAGEQFFAVAGWSPPVASRGAIAAWTAVEDSRLEQTRGGFDFGGGLLASFGIERQIFINGALVTTTSLQIPDVSRLTAEQSAALATTVGSTQWVQNGLGNRIDAAALQGSGGTLIQNSLDNQQIQGLTTLNVGVNNLGELHGMNLQDSLQSAALLGSRGQ
jgi:hypothetical protein